MPKTLARGNLVQNKSKESETFLAVNELQKVANSVYRIGPLTLKTSDAGPDTIWTSDQVPEGQLWSVVAQIQCQGTGVQGYFRRDSLFFRNSGGATTLVGTAPTTVRSDTFISVNPTTSGNSIILTVSDTSARALSWSAWIEVRTST